MRSGGASFAGGAELRDLRPGQVAGRTAHGVEGLQDVAMVVVDAPDLGGCVGWDVFRSRSNVLGGPAGPEGMVYVGASAVGGA